GRVGQDDQGPRTARRARPGLPDDRGVPRDSRREPQGSYGGVVSLLRKALASVWMRGPFLLVSSAQKRAKVWRGVGNLAEARENLVRGAKCVFRMAGKTYLVPLSWRLERASSAGGARASSAGGR